MSTCSSKTCVKLTPVQRPILRGLPYSVGVRLLQSDGTPHDLTPFSVKSSLKSAAGAEIPFTVTTGSGMFVLKLTQAETTALASGNYTSDILVRQGNEVFRRAELSYRVETPRTTPVIDLSLISTPDPVFEFKDTVLDVVQLQGGTDVAATIAAAIAAHEAGGNPHPQYQAELASQVLTFGVVPTFSLGQVAGVVGQIRISVLQAFDDPAATLSIGDTGDSQRLVGLSQVDLSSANVFSVNPPLDLGATAVQINAYLNAGASTVGRLKVVIYEG